MKRTIAPLAVLVGLWAAGCGGGDDKGVTRTRGAGVKPAGETGRGGGAPPPTAAGTAPGAPAAGPEAAPPGASGTSLSDKEIVELLAWRPGVEPPMENAAFVEGIDTRDPFRTFRTEVAEEAGKRKKTKDAILPLYALDELKLIAVISGIPNPKAMLIDPKGFGWIVRKNDRLSKSAALITRILGDEVELSETDESSGTEVKRVLKLNPERIDPLRVLHGPPDALWKGAAAEPEAAEAAAAGPAPEAGGPELRVGMSKSDFLRGWGHCYRRTVSRALPGAAASSTRGEWYARVSATGRCAGATGGLVVIDADRVVSIQTL